MAAGGIRKETNQIEGSSYKLLVVDIDGTLLSRERLIPARNAAALGEAKSRGVAVALSTGRAVQACLPIIDKLALDGPHVFCDGAFIHNPARGEDVYVEPLSPAVVKRAVEFAQTNDIDLDLYSTTRYFAEKETWSVEAHRQFFGVEPVILDFSNIWDKEIIIKIGLVSTSAGEGAKLQNFCSHVGNSCHLSWARTPAYIGTDFINVVASGVSKGRALEILAAHLGIPLSEVMVVGDGINDISLMNRAGLAVAMGNAPDEVKAAADHVTLNVEADGLAVAIDELLFNLDRSG